MQKVKAYYDASGVPMAIYSQEVIGESTTTKTEDLMVYGLSRIGTYHVDETTGGAPSTLTPAKEQFELTDHLGNVRAVVTGELTSGNPDVVSLNDYYAFGSSMRSFSSQAYRYGFNGKELDPETNLIDFGARMYDARIGRWFAVDPHAKSYTSYSPYSFAINSPLTLVDKDGRDIYAAGNAQSQLTTAVQIVFCDAESDAFTFDSEGKLIVNVAKVHPATDEQKALLDVFTGYIVKNHNVKITYTANPEIGTGNISPQYCTYPQLLEEHEVFNQTINVNPTNQEESEAAQYDSKDDIQQNFVSSIGLSSEMVNILKSWHEFGHLILGLWRWPASTEDFPRKVANFQYAVGFENYVRKTLNIQDRAGYTHGGSLSGTTSQGVNFKLDLSGNKNVDINIMNSISNSLLMHIIPSSGGENYIPSGATNGGGYSNSSGGGQSGGTYHNVRNL